MNISISLFPDGPCNLFEDHRQRMNHLIWVVANIGFTRSAKILRVDSETIRIIGAESAQVKLEFVMAHK